MRTGLGEAVYEAVEETAGGGAGVGGGDGGGDGDGDGDMGAWWYESRREGEEALVSDLSRPLVPEWWMQAAPGDAWAGGGSVRGGDTVSARSGATVGLTPTLRFAMPLGWPQPATPSAAWGAGRGGDGVAARDRPGVSEVSRTLGFGGTAVDEGESSATSGVSASVVAGAGAGSGAGVGLGLGAAKAVAVRVTGCDAVIQIPRKDLGRVAMLESFFRTGAVDRHLVRDKWTKLVPGMRWGEFDPRVGSKVVVVDPVNRDDAGPTEAVLRAIAAGGAGEDGCITESCASVPLFFLVLQAGCGLGASGLVSKLEETLGLMVARTKGKLFLPALLFAQEHALCGLREACARVFSLHWRNIPDRVLARLPEAFVARCLGDRSRFWAASEFDRYRVAARYLTIKSQARVTERPAAKVPSPCRENGLLSFDALVAGCRASAPQRPILPTFMSRDMRALLESGIRYENFGPQERALVEKDRLATPEAMLGSAVLGASLEDLEVLLGGFRPSGISTLESALRDMESAILCERAPSVPLELVAKRASLELEVAGASCPAAWTRLAKGAERLARLHASALDLVEQARCQALGKVRRGNDTTYFGEADGGGERSNAGWHRLQRQWSAIWRSRLEEGLPGVDWVFWSHFQRSCLAWSHHIRASQSKVLLVAWKARMDEVEAHKARADTHRLRFCLSVYRKAVALEAKETRCLEEKADALRWQQIARCSGKSMFHANRERVAAVVSAATWCQSQRRMLPARRAHVFVLASVVKCQALVRAYLARDYVRALRKAASFEVSQLHKRAFVGFQLRLSQARADYDRAARLNAEHVVARSLRGLVAHVQLRTSASVTVQRVQRGVWGRREAAERRRAVTKLQAFFRGKMARTSFLDCVWACGVLQNAFRHKLACLSRARSVSEANKHRVTRLLSSSLAVLALRAQRRKIFGNSAQCTEAKAQDAPRSVGPTGIVPSEIFHVHLVDRHASSRSPPPPAVPTTSTPQKNAKPGKEQRADDPTACLTASKSKGRSPKERSSLPTFGGVTPLQFVLRSLGRGRSARRISHRPSEYELQGNMSQASAARKRSKFASVESFADGPARLAGTPSRLGMSYVSPTVQQGTGMAGFGKRIGVNPMVELLGLQAEAEAEEASIADGAITEAAETPEATPLKVGPRAPPSPIAMPSLMPYSEGGSPVDGFAGVAGGLSKSMYYAGSCWTLGVEKRMEKLAFPREWDPLEVGQVRSVEVYWVRLTRTRPSPYVDWPRVNLTKQHRVAYAVKFLSEQTGEGEMEAISGEASFELGCSHAIALPVAAMKPWLEALSDGSGGAALRMTVELRHIASDGGDCGGLTSDFCTYPPVFATGSEVEVVCTTRAIPGQGKASLYADASLGAEGLERWATMMWDIGRDFRMVTRPGGCEVNFRRPGWSGAALCGQASSFEIIPGNEVRHAHPGRHHGASGRYHVPSQAALRAATLAAAVSRDWIDLGPGGREGMALVEFRVRDSSSGHLLSRKFPLAPAQTKGLSRMLRRSLAAFVTEAEPGAVDESAAQSKLPRFQLTTPTGNVVYDPRCHGDAQLGSALSKATLHDEPLHVRAILPAMPWDELDPEDTFFDCYDSDGGARENPAQGDEALSRWRPASALHA